MNSTKKVLSGSLNQNAIAQIERIVWKNGDDIAVSVARSLERMEERLDGMESRLSSRFSELAGQIEETAPQAKAAHQ